MSTTPGGAIAPQETTHADVIDQIAGIAPGSRLAELRASKPQIVHYAESSYRVLLEPEDPAGVSLVERAMIALRVAYLTPSEAAATWYRDRLRDLGADTPKIAAIEGLAERAILTPREAAVLRHTDILTQEPGNATAGDLAALKSVGLGPRDIVTISQLIAFVSFQVRILAGLRQFAEEV